MSRSLSSQSTHAVGTSIATADWPENPYKGLSFYKSSDVALFGGRHADVRACARIIAREDTKVMLLYGTTGCGKSSFLRAGLIPYLESEVARFQFLSTYDVDETKALFIRCTDSPLVRMCETLYDWSNKPFKIEPPDASPQYLDLSSILGETSTRSSFIDTTATKIENLIVTLRQLGSLLPRTLVLIIDQGEEILTLGDTNNNDESSSGKLFFDFLAAFSTAAIDLKLIVTLRKEYFGDFFEQLDRRNYNRTHLRYFKLDELNKEQLVEAIRIPISSNIPRKFLQGRIQPGDFYDCDFEPKLPERIANDLWGVKTKGGVLPVLQIALQRLYSRAKARVKETLEEVEAPANQGSRTPWLITAGDYETLGDLEDQISQHLEETILEKIDAECPGMNDAQREQELTLWKDLLFGLVEETEDNRALSRIADANRLSAAAETLGCRIKFENMAAFLASDNRRILREDSRRVDIGDRAQGSVDRTRSRPPEFLLDLAQSEQEKSFYSLGHDAIAVALSKWGATRKLFTIFRHAQRIEQATSELFQLDTRAKQFCHYVRNRLRFDFVAVQLVNRKEQVIQTIWGLYGSRSSGGWYKIAGHPIGGDDRFLDIQAYVASNTPPRIEVIEGWDPHFDEFIYRKFGHEHYVRAFAPLIISRTEEGMAAELDPHHYRVEALDGDSSCGSIGVTLTAPYEIIGTIEAGFDNSNRLAHEKKNISGECVRELFELACRQALVMYRATLVHLLDLITDSAREIVEADGATLDLWFDRRRNRYNYRACAGLSTSVCAEPRDEALLDRVIEKSVPRLAPSKELSLSISSFSPDALDAGFRSTPAIPLMTDDAASSSVAERSLLAGGNKPDVLTVRFKKTHYFTPEERDGLTFFANLARAAISQATFYVQSIHAERQIANLHDITKTLANEADASVYLFDIAGHGMNLLAADIVIIYEYDSSKQRFLSEPAIAGRLTRRPFKDYSYTPREELIGNEGVLPAPSPQKLLALYASNQHFETCQQFIRDEGLESGVAVTLRLGQEVVGLMFVNYRRSLPVYERSLIETFASAAAVAIGNRRLLRGPRSTLS